MQWSAEAEAAIRKVPFFVRKRVRVRVEKEAGEAGKTTVTLADVNATQQRYMAGMAAEVKGYQLDACFGPAGCPNRIEVAPPLSERLENLLRDAGLLDFLRSKGVTHLKFHHEFRVTLADCPNACSQPQIKDIGIIAAAFPAVGEQACSGCGACVEACRESAVKLDHRPQPVIEVQNCVACGQCVAACPNGSLECGLKGYRVHLGGKLGRHPQLARELPGIYDADTVVEIVAACLTFYKSRSTRGERLGQLLQKEDFQRLAQRFKAKDPRLKAKERTGG